MCSAGHTFDANKRGYLNLVDSSRGIHGDTRAILEARERFLDRGHYSPIVDLLDAALPGDAVDVVDSGCGSGYYAAALAARRPSTRLLELDVSPDAVTLAVRATGAPGVVADVWRPLPVRSDRADAVLCVFAPRNADEFSRLLRPGGALVVVTPAPGHLEQLRQSGRLIGMQPHKLEQLDETLAARFELTDRRSTAYDLRLDDHEIDDLAAMGPSGHHAAHPRPAETRSVTTTVSVAVDVSVYSPR